MNKTTEALKLAEEALRLIIDGGDNEDDEMFYQGLTKGNEAIAAIRAARAQEQAEQGPVAFHRASFLSGYEAAQSDANACDVPPQGWLCTRQAGHDGPCAAIEDNNGRELVNRAMLRLAEQEAAPQPVKQEPEYKGWYCAHCERGVDGSEVTFHEQHEVCGRVITDDVPPKPVKQEPAADPYNGDDGPGFDYNFHEKLKAGLHLMSFGEQKLWNAGWDAAKAFYAAPVQQVDLTDDEIYPLYNEPTSDREAIEFARAVIAAYKEKNRANHNT